VSPDDVSAADLSTEGLSADGRAALNDSFVLLPDMPAPELDIELRSRGAAGAAPAPVTVPPAEPLTTGNSWFDAVDANPFHGGLLSGLRTYA
jgi:5-methylthioadenosine/S-adenosylhomocysteine deaminase